MDNVNCGSTGSQVTPAMTTLVLQEPITSKSKLQANPSRLVSTPPGRPPLKVLLEKEKSTNKSITSFFASPSTKRAAASNDNLGDLYSPTIKKKTTSIPQFPDLNSSETETVESLSSDTSLNDTVIQVENMSTNDTNSPALVTAPPLDSPNIDPQMRNFLQFMLQENRTLSEKNEKMLFENKAINEKMLAVQYENSKRLESVEKAIAQIQEDRGKDTKFLECVNNRLINLEGEHKQDMSHICERLVQVETGKNSSCCQENGTVKRLEERLEAQDRASRQNSIVIKGLPLPVMSLKSHACQFLRDKFNYVGQVSNVRALGRDSKNPEKTDFFTVTLESLEDKINVLRNKKTILENMKSVRLRSDLTTRERKCATELGKFAKRLQPDGKGVKFAHQAVSVRGSWYKWDIERNDAVRWSGPKSRDFSTGDGPSGGQAFRAQDTLHVEPLGVNNLNGTSNSQPQSKNAQ